MIESMLVLSTGNLTEATCNRWLPTSGYPAFEKPEFGWFVYVGEPDDDLPVDLLACMALARDRRCCWIMFDRDAPPAAELPRYDW
jgi:hypothetical protein